MRTLSRFAVEKNKNCKNMKSPVNMRNILFVAFTRVYSFYYIYFFFTSFFFCFFLIGMLTIKWYVYIHIQKRWRQDKKNPTNNIGLFFLFSATRIINIPICVSSNKLTHSIIYIYTFHNIICINCICSLFFILCKSENCSHRRKRFSEEGKSEDFFCKKKNRIW